MKTQMLPLSAGICCVCLPPQGATSHDVTGSDKELQAAAVQSRVLLSEVRWCAVASGAAVVWKVGHATEEGGKEEAHGCRSCWRCHLRMLTWRRGQSGQPEAPGSYRMDEGGLSTMPATTAQSNGRATTQEKRDSFLCYTGPDAGRKRKQGGPAGVTLRPNSN